MVAAFALWEPRLRRAWLFLVPLVLFLPDRSLANYLTDFVPAALVAAVTVTSLHRFGLPGSSADPTVTSAPGVDRRGSAEGRWPFPQRHRWPCSSWRSRRRRSG